MIAPLKTKENYWQDFRIEKSDIEFIYNILLEKEIPLTTEEIFDQLINFRIEQQIKNLKDRKSNQGNIYLPKDEHEVGDELVFPALDSESGKVTGVRKGSNPDYENLKVIEVEMVSGGSRSFAINISEHPLNHILDISEDDPNLDGNFVKEEYGDEIRAALVNSLQENEDLVKIAGNWFPQSLLVDVNIGHLNLAEAVLEEASGGPLNTASLMEQVELNAKADQKLLEFSFDLALQEDSRFDEVGPTGETLWFLHAEEPEHVKQIPIYLKYSGDEYPRQGLEKYLGQFEGNVYDELEEWDSSPKSEKKVSISLIYPHWRSGTLPLSRTLKNMFPSAYEAPRVKFTFVDEVQGNSFPGWVVRPNNYIYGLGDWYEKNDLMPGSLVTVEKGKLPGEVRVSYQKSRQNKEWMKTVLIGSDQGIVFAMLKHPISASFNERMAVAVPDIEAVEEIWNKKVYSKEGFDKTILRIMRELTKLNPQGQVHAQELYAAVNVVQRCPPGRVLQYLLASDSISHLGDLYFRIEEKK